MKIIGVIIFATFCSLNLSAQVTGKIFPALEAETVEDKKVKLPLDTKGKYTLLGLAYSKKSEEDLNSWFQPVFEKFLEEPFRPFVVVGIARHRFALPVEHRAHAA